MRRIAGHRHVARAVVFAVASGLSLAIGSCSVPRDDGGGTGGAAPALRLRAVEVVQGLRAPLYVVSPPSDPRLFVVEQGGRVRIVKGGSLVPRPFLDIADRLRSGGEQGLLSLAFHPRYATNGFFYVNYTDRRGDTRVERYSVSRDPDVADPGTGALILAVDQPYSNHNGGHVLFGPDGMLYIGMGDGGAGGDPHDNGQNRGSLLGKLLRIDVDHGDPYRIPRDNPFARTPGTRPEIWGWGLRNPWRFCFDPEAGLLYIADVGQDRWEEIDVVPASRGGLNFGWNIMEGAHDFRVRGRSRQALVRPALEYDHSEGCSITGGFVYRGRSIPALRGHYFYSDYCKGWLRSFRYANGRAVDRRDWGLNLGDVTSFGVDAAGELYVTSANGTVYRIAQAR